MSTPDRDLVEQLRQRVALAMKGHVVALGLGNPGTDLTDALGAFEAELDDSDPADPAMLAVACALLGEARPTDVDYEWCVFLGSDDPNGDVARITTDTQEHAEEALALVLQTHGAHRMGVAYRTVTYSPWRVVDTEGGE